MNHRYAPPSGSGPKPKCPAFGRREFGPWADVRAPQCYHLRLDLVPAQIRDSVQPKLVSSQALSVTFGATSMPDHPPETTRSLCNVREESQAKRNTPCYTLRTAPSKNSGPMPASIEAQDAPEAMRMRHPVLSGTSVAYPDADGETQQVEDILPGACTTLCRRGRLPPGLPMALGLRRNWRGSDAAGRAPRQPPRQHPDLEWIESVS